MDQAQIELIVRKAISGEVAANWVFYTLVLAVVIVGGSAVSFLASYLQSRGKTYATRADFEELLAQLKQTTETSEKIKAAVLHDDWKVKEYKTLRRGKLEELLETVNACTDWLDKVRQSWHRDFDTGPSPFSKASMLARLYFPELKAEAAAFSLAYHAHQSMLVEGAGKHSQCEDR